MKIDRRTLALIIASLCGTCSVSQGQEGATTLLSLADGNYSGTVEPAGAHSVHPAANLGSASGSLSDKDSSSDLMQGSGQSSSSIPGSLAGFNSSMSNCEASASGTEHCSPCGTGGTTISRAAPSPGIGWMDFDTLFWWGRGLTNSPVITGGTTFPPTTPLLGGADHPIGTNLQFGLRTDVGLWLDDCQNYGVGGRAWGILSGGQEQIITNGGNPTGLQFFNTRLDGLTDYRLVNIPNGIPPYSGTIGVLSDLDVVSGELYLRSRLIGERSNRTDLLTGYTFLRLDSEYRLQTSTSTTSGPAITTLDQFATTNTFHGGHIGLSNNMSRGRFGFGLSGKVALGNMEATSTASGAQVPNVNANSGFFVQNSNNDPISRNYFTFIPEANAKMRYRLGHAELGVGYTLVVLPNVAMAASQVDKYVYAPYVAGVPSPQPQFNTEAFFLHGLDLGLTFRF